MPMSQGLLGEFTHEMEVTRKYLERLPEEHFGWRPHPKSRPLGALAHHISQIPSYVERRLNTESFDFGLAGQAPPPAAPQASRQQLLDNFDRNVAQAKEALGAATDEQLQHPWTLLRAGKAIFTVPRAAVLRSMVLSHLIHHRAQLGVYLRMHDIPVPATYGPSADE
ncbi:MAG: DinB family protein [Terriglobales bacterium]